MPYYYRKFFLILLFSGVFCAHDSAQNPNSDSVERRQEQRQEEQRRQQEESSRQQREDADFARRTNDLLRPGRGFGTAAAVEAAHLSKEEKRKLAPAAADLTKYKTFLQSPNTGIFRLFPDSGCRSFGVVRVDGDCANAVADGWNYSFRRSKYSASDFGDVQFKNGKLTSRGFLLQGIFTPLGDVAPESVSLADGALKFLLDFAPSDKSAKMNRQLEQITEGIKIGGYKYTNSVDAAENTTYALRAVAYRLAAESARRFSPNNINFDPKFLSLTDDKRIDLIVVFRIVRRAEEDGGITIIWKELQRREAPKLVLEKDPKPVGAL